MQMNKRLAVGAVFAAAGLMAAACSSSSTTGASGASTSGKTTKVTTASASVRKHPPGSAVFGTVSSVSGSQFDLSTTKGSKTVLTTSSTRFSQVVTVDTAALSVGQCVRASGPVNSIGTVEATSIIIMPASGAPGSTQTPPPSTTGAGPSSTSASASGPSASGGCSLGFGSFRRTGVRRHFAGTSGSSAAGHFPAGSYPYAGASGSSSSGQASFQGAFGKIAAIEPAPSGSTGETLEVQGPSGQTGVAVSSSTKVLETESATIASVTPGICASAFGKVSATGELQATSVTVTPAGPSGCSAPFAGAGPLTRAGGT